MAGASRKREHSGWRGGIGIAFGSPSRWIPDVMELGYEIAWGMEDYPAEVAGILGVAIYRYWNSIVEVMLKDPHGRYDFSGMEDKGAAALAAFDAWAEGQVGGIGLSRYASVQYRPDGSYGDVMGTMDYSSPNPLVNGLVETYLRWFEENRVSTGGIALDNAGKVPRAFVETLRARFRSKGLGIATNGCPDELLPLVDFFGNEGFPFGVERGRDARAKGFRGILGEFTMQHLSGGELEAYLRTKLFNRIVFFGYTNGGTAAGAAHSFYARRPDVYEHQRWVFRKYVSLSRAVQRAGEREEPHASFTGRRVSGSDQTAAGGGNRADGAVYEWNRKYDVQELLRNAVGEPFVRRFGDAAGGVYLYVGSTVPGKLRCHAASLGLLADAVVWDEFGERLLPSTRRGAVIDVAVSESPALLQLGRPAAIVTNILSRIEELLDLELKQRALDRCGRRAHALKPWRAFCDGYALDDVVSRSGGASLRLSGGERSTYNGKYRYHAREGAAQLVDLNQVDPVPLTLEAWSRCEKVIRSDSVTLRSWAERDRHFSAREGGTYAIHLYLDYQDGIWPEVGSASFTAGTHDWEHRTLTIHPSKPARTALILVELHQSAGRAWFDDLELVQADRPDDNLLVFAGFETDWDMGRAAGQSSEEYERRIREIAAAIEVCRGAPGIGRIESLAGAVRELRLWVDSRGLTRLWSYEVRDLADAERRLETCLRVLRG